MAEFCVFCLRLLNRGVAGIGLGGPGGVVVEEKLKKMEEKSKTEMEERSKTEMEEPKKSEKKKVNKPMSDSF